MSDFLYYNTNQNFSEHHKWPEGEDVTNCFDFLPDSILYLGKRDCFCVEFRLKDERKALLTSYYVGVDWIGEGKAIYVEPKLNDVDTQTDYLKMLFSALSHPEVSQHTADLFEIKFDKPHIEIKQQQDILTPLLVVQFFKIVKEIVRKGLKKSYYKIENNLYAKVRGKVIVGQTIKQNLLKNKSLNTFCSYDEFGLNGLENRLLKKALLFVQRYLPTLRIPHSDEYITQVFNYINPAFEFVSEEVNLHDVKHTKTNAFYKEYAEGIRLAKLILKRFGYNITNTQQQATIKTPPFWIDMSKLFELYVLGLLKERFRGAGVVDYHFGDRSNELDYLLNAEGYRMVVDAKYKPRYKFGLDKHLHQDIRQVSGYARLEKVYQSLGVNKDNLIDCLIIFPDQSLDRFDLKEVQLKAEKINDYVSIYKLGVSLPQLPFLKK